MSPLFPQNLRLSLIALRFLLSPILTVMYLLFMHHALHVLDALLSAQPDVFISLINIESS